MVPIPKSQRAKHQVNSRGSRPPTHRFKFTFDEAAMRADQEYDGYSAIVATVPKGKLSDDDVFTKFKQQTYSEVGQSYFQRPGRSSSHLSCIHRSESKLSRFY